MIKAQNNNQDRKPRQRATIQNLPVGANDDNAWTRVVIPNFIRLIMSGEQPWLIADDTIVSDLQNIWNYVYGRRVRFEVKKGTVPFDLVSFFLFQYSCGLPIFFSGCTETLRLPKQDCVPGALCCAYNLCEDRDDIHMDASELAELAKGLLANRNQFIFKGMENKHRQIG